MQPGPIPIGALIVRKQKAIVAALRQAGATSVVRAVSCDSLGIQQNLAFKKLQGHTVVRESVPGRFYLDESSWEVLRQTRRRVALTAALAVVAILAILWFGTQYQ